MRKIFFLLVFFIGCSKYNYEKLLSDATELSDKGLYKDAIRLVTTAIELDSFRTDGYVLRGRLLNQINEPKKALKDFKLGNSIDPESNLILYNLGITYYLLDHNDSAVIYLDKAILKKGTDSIYIEFNINNKSIRDDIPMVQIRFNRGLAYYYLNKLNESVNDFQFCVSKNYNKGESLLYLGNIYIDTGELIKGCRYLRLSLENGQKEAEQYLKEKCK